MFRTIVPALLCLAPAAQAADVSAWLIQADAYRLVADSARVEVEVRLYKKDVLDKRRDYRVYIKPGRRSLVVFMSPGEVGQKVLMRDDEFHLFLPRSRRAIRITPMQKLLGEASTGDVANMTWHEDYEARLVSESETVDRVDCVLLELHARRHGTTYERIELYLARQNHAPVYARLFLTSGKLAKEARYILSGDVVTGMTLVDRIRPGRRTEVDYRAMTPMAIPDKFFNPQYLLRAEVE